MFAGLLIDHARPALQGERHRVTSDGQAAGGELRRSVGRHVLASEVTG